MVRPFLIVLASAAAALAMFGCSSEETSEGESSANAAANDPGSPRAGTANQLSLNPDYKGK